MNLTGTWNPITLFEIWGVSAPVDRHPWEQGMQYEQNLWCIKPKSAFEYKTFLNIILFLQESCFLLSLHVCNQKKWKIEVKRKIVWKCMLCMLENTISCKSLVVCLCFFIT